MIMADHHPATTTYPPDVTYIASPVFIGYNKKMNNTFKISPGMSVRAISRLALDLGCEVIIGNAPGDISLKHPSIGSSLVLSDQQNPGNKFALWIKPLINDKWEISTMLNLESQQGRIAKTLQKLSYPDKLVVLNDLITEFETILTKKQVADGVSHLIRRGYVERLEPGKYKTTEMLNQAVGTYKADEGQREAPVQEPLEKPVKIRRKRREAGVDVDLVKFEGFIERLEGAVEKLETVARELQGHKELEEALDVLEKALARRKQSW